MSLDGGGENLGTATGYVRIDSSGVTSGMDAARRAFDNGLHGVGDRIKSIGDGMTGLGTRITLLTAPMTAFGASGLNAARAFDASLAEIAARTGLVGEEMDRVRQLALQMGADTVFSAQQSSDAFLQLLTAGLSVEDAIATLPNVLNAAAASGENLGRSADFVTNVMASFRLEADETGRIVEAMSRAAASSPATMGQMGEALQEVGGLATSMGISLEETSAMLAIFAQSGVRGSEAGTQFRSMLLNMTRDTEDVSNAWYNMGISMTDTEGNFRSMNDIMNDLTAALSTMTEAEAADVMRDLGGSYGLVGLNALTAGQSIDEMMAIMEGQSSAADVAAARMRTFDGTIESLMGSIETLQIIALTPFMTETLQPLAEQLIVMVNNVTAWATANPELTKTIVTVAAAISILGPILIAAGIAISALAVPIGLIATLIAFLLSPIGLVIVAVGALAFAVATHFDEIRTWFSNLRDHAQEIFQDIRDSVTQFTDNFVEDLRSKNDTIKAVIGTLTEAFNTAFADIDRDSILEIGLLIASLATPFGWVMMAARLMGVDVIGVFNTLIDEIMNALSSAGVDFTQPVSTWGPAILEAITTGLGNIATWISDNIITPFVESLSGGAGDVAGGLEGWGPELLATAEAFIQDVAYEIGRLPGRAGALLAQLLPDLIAGVVEYGPKVLAAILIGFGAIALWIAENIILPMFNGLVDGAQELIAAVNTYGPDILEEIRTGFGDLLTWIFENVITPLVTALVNGTADLIEAVINYGPDVLATILDGLGDLAAWIFENVITPFAQRLAGGAFELAEAVINYGPDVLASILSSLGDLVEWVFANIITPIAQRLAGLPGDAAEAVVNFGPDLLAGLLSGLGNLAEWVATNIVGPIVGEIEKIGAAAQSAIDSITSIPDQMASNAQMGGDIAQGFVQDPGKMVGAVFTSLFRDSGGPGQPNMRYLIGPDQQGNEAFIPGDSGYFYPNLQQTIAQLVASALGEHGGGQQTTQIIVQVQPELLRSMPQAETNGRAFGDEFWRQYRAKGN